MDNDKNFAEFEAWLQTPEGQDWQEEMGEKAAEEIRRRERLEEEMEDGRPTRWDVM